jgi:two-component system chemotaxis response regulator CheY
LPTDNNALPSASILLVDDDPAILHLLTHLLETGGHRVRTAVDGNKALQMILQDCPDVLMTDWMMPGLDGLELCRRVRQLHARHVLSHYPYILLLTAQSSKKSFVEGLEAGADDFIEKSIGSLADLRIEMNARLNAALRIRKLEADLAFAAKYDSMTQLLNRVTFFDLAQVVWDRSLQNKFPLAAVMVDCDFFKRINDIHGHLAGDAVLKEIAALLRSFSRSSDLICRYGGEEFCVLLPGCNEKTAWDWAERIRKQLETNPIRHGNFEVRVTSSFGIAERVEDSGYLDQLIERADQALLDAKDRGRNSCVRYSEMMIGNASGDAATDRSIDLFRDKTAGDVMTPFPFCIRPTDTVATVMNYFLETRIETLPVIDDDGNLIGVVSESNLISLLGSTKRWLEPIDDLVAPNIISYPPETPLRTIFGFLCRVAARQLLIVQDKAPVGFINRTPLLRWLRNHWATIHGNFEEIIPSTSVRGLPIHSLKNAVEALINELENFDGIVVERPDRTRLVTFISHSQDIMDQILKYGAMQETSE